MISNGVKSGIVQWTLAAVAVAFLLALVSMIRLGLHIQRAGELDSRELAAAGALRDEQILSAMSELKLMNDRLDRQCDRISDLEVQVFGQSKAVGAKAQERKKAE